MIREGPVRITSPSGSYFGTAATKTNSRRSVAGDPHNVEARLAAKRVLKYSPVQLPGAQAVSVVKGFAKACDEGDYHLHPCAVLPDHIHLVIGAHTRRIQQIVGNLRARGTQQLKEAHGFNRPVWGAHGWNVFLDNLADALRAIAYVEQNPVKEGKRRQHWSIVSAFNLKKARPRRVETTHPRLGGAALKSHEKRVASERG